MSKYEILAGEQRWTNAKAAGLKTVPCRIMDLDDDAARNIFHITNLLRRDLSPRDLIYGWYNYYTQIKGGNSADEAINVEITNGSGSGAGSGGGYGGRQVGDSAYDPAICPYA